MTAVMVPELEPLTTPPPFVPVRFRGTGMDWRNAEEFRPSSRSALRFATSVVLDTANGAPGAVNDGAAEKALAPVNVWMVFSRATLLESRASASVPVERLAALRLTRPAPEPEKELEALPRVRALE